MSKKSAMTYAELREIWLSNMSKRKTEKISKIIDEYEKEGISTETAFKGIAKLFCNM